MSADPDPEDCEGCTNAEWNPWDAAEAENDLDLAARTQAL